MTVLDPLVEYSVFGALLGFLTAYVLFQPTPFVQWLQKKNYQYEVTFALYMLTPTEKFVFNSILFLNFSMFAIACVLYLPDHVSIISRRVYYYFAGDITILHASRTAAIQIGGTASKASEAVLGVASDFAGAAYQAARNTAVVAQEAMNQAATTLRWA